MIRPIMSRARAASWSSYQSDLRRRRRLQEACASILQSKTCLRLSVGSPEQRLALVLILAILPQALPSTPEQTCSWRTAVCRPGLASLRRSRWRYQTGLTEREGGIVGKLYRLAGGILNGGERVPSTMRQAVSPKPGRRSFTVAHPPTPHSGVSFRS